MIGSERRFFSASSLTLAVAAAARWYGVDPERLAYRLRDKRHGFVKSPRGVVIEVDPTAPERAAGVEPERPSARSGAQVPPIRERRPDPADSSRGRPGGHREARAGRPRRGERGAGEIPESEKWSSPDADSELAAREASIRLMRFAGLSLEPAVSPNGDRLEVRLAGSDEPELARRGVVLLDDLEHLLPRAIHGLCGRMVRVRVEGAGLRAARERELVDLAEEAAARVLAGESDELLEALAPAERRIVHLTLADRRGIATESVGDGFRKRLRIFATSAGQGRSNE
jgi:spoIIIJ-associated protein